MNVRSCRFAVVCNLIIAASFSQVSCVDSSFTPEAIESRIVYRTLSSGVDAAFLHTDGEEEIVTIKLTLRYGDLENQKPIGVQVAAGLLPELMLRGVKSMDTRAFRAELERNEATLSVWGRYSVVMFTLSAPRGKLPEALELLRQTLREPRLSDDDFVALKQERLAALLVSQSQARPVALSVVRHYNHEYAENDIRYLPFIDEKIKRLRSVIHEDVLRVYGDFLGGENGQLAVVGSFDLEYMVAMFESMLSNWGAKESYAIPHDEVPVNKPSEVQRVSIANTKGAAFYGALVFNFNQNHPDYPALRMASEIFGGRGHSSRLSKRFEAEANLGSGVYSALWVDDDDELAVMDVFAHSSSERILDAEEALFDELNRMRESVPSQEELNTVRAPFLKEQAAARESDAALVEMISTNLYMGRTMEWHGWYENGIRSVTLEQVRTAFAKHMDASEMVRASVAP